MARYGDQPRKNTRYWDYEDNEPRVGAIIRDICFGTLVGVAATMYGCPQYNVWKQGLVGEAELRRAEQNRRILITQAQAEEEAAKSRAAAISIVGEMAHKFPEYRHQEFIGAFAHALQEGKINQIIYVPTEGNIPVLEAGRLTPR